MSAFRDALDRHNPSDHDDRDWVFVPYDQLTDAVGPLAETSPDELGIVMVETSWKGDRRPYHRQKLALILANQRHFALEQARRGVAVQYLTDDRPYLPILAEAADDLGRLTVMEPAERELRMDLSPLAGTDALNVVPHQGWMTTADDFVTSQGDNVPPWRMDAFYRHLRRKTGILMEDGSPAGGQFSHDGDNREFWPGEPPAPEPPTFEPDAITREVADVIETHYDHHPGQMDLEALPATADDADALWEWAKARCMESFGPYEDALSTKSRGLFHTRISPLLNIHRLLPERTVREVESLDIPINSKEGFIRQVLGWREFMRHVHRETDGFRALPAGWDSPAVDDSPGSGGWETWTGETWNSPAAAEQPSSLDGGALPNALNARRDLPPAYWGKESGMRCLDVVVEEVLEDGWTHHIARLMVLSNIGTLLGVSPRELTDWFWVAYVDAFDWVVEPNVLGMGTFGLGDLFVTKPYVSGSNYIDKMSDYCSDCQFDPGSTCPLKPMYWAFLQEHEDELDDNQRMGLMLGMMRKRSDQTKDDDMAILEHVRDKLEAGQRLTEDDGTPPFDGN